MCPQVSLSSFIGDPVLGIDLPLLDAMNFYVYRSKGIHTPTAMQQKNRLLIE